MTHRRGSVHIRHRRLPRERHTIVGEDALGFPQGRSPSEFKYAHKEASKDTMNLYTVDSVSFVSSNAFLLIVFKFGRLYNKRDRIFNLFF